MSAKARLFSTKLLKIWKNCIKTNTEEGVYSIGVRVFSGPVKSTKSNRQEYIN